MIKKLTVIVAALLAAAIIAAIVVTVKSRQTVEEPSAAVTEEEESSGSGYVTAGDVSGDESKTDENKDKEKKDKKEKKTKADDETTVPQTVPMPDYEVSEEFSAPEAIKPKLKRRSFKGQNDRIKLYKKYCEKAYENGEADVFLYDLTHDGKCDLLVVTPLKDDKNKTVGAIVQIFTILEKNTVTEIFRDYGGFTASGGSFCCYVIEDEGKDCLLISKDEMVQDVGTLSYTVFYVLEDGKIINSKSMKVVAEENDYLDNQYALDRYSKNLEELIDAAHTTVVDYRIPYAVTSKPGDALK